MHHQLGIPGRKSYISQIEMIQQLGIYPGEDACWLAWYWCLKKVLWNVTGITEITMEITEITIGGGGGGGGGGGRWE